MKAMTWFTAIVAAGGLLLTAWVWGASPGADEPAVGRTSRTPSAAAGAQASGTRPGPVRRRPGDLLPPLRGDRAGPARLDQGPQEHQDGQSLPRIPRAVRADRGPGRPGSPADRHHGIDDCAGARCSGGWWGQLRGATSRRDVGANTLPLLGALNLFDLNAFYQELFGSLGVMLADEGTRAQFMKDLAAQDPEYAILTQQFLAAVAVASQLDGASQKQAATLFQVRLDPGGQGGRREGRGRGEAGQPPNPAAIAAPKKAVSAKVGHLAEKDMLGLVCWSSESRSSTIRLTRRSRPPPTPCSSGSSSSSRSSCRCSGRGCGSSPACRHCTRPSGPCRARAGSMPSTASAISSSPGPTPSPPDSPVSYPELWLVNQTYWLHWDGNTNSLIQRNIGQALEHRASPFEAVGQGNYHSLVQPVNIHQLETTVKLTPPEWPAPLFGPIDAAKAARGKVIYEDRCIDCHAPASAGRPRHPRRHPRRAEMGRPAGRPRAADRALPDLLEKVIPVDKVGTDPARAMNFATNVGRQNRVHRRDRLLHGPGRCGVAIQPDVLQG